MLSPLPQPDPHRYRKLAPAPPEGPLDLARLLPGSDDPGGEIELEIGYGHGRFLIERAAACPGTRIVGVEVKRKWAFLVAERCARRGLHNATAWGADDLSGVTMQTAPSKRSSRAASSPVCSEPAMGCDPTNRPGPLAKMPFNWSQTGAFTLPTSVTSAPFAKWGAIFRAMSGMVPIGVANTTVSTPATTFAKSVEASSAQARSRTAATASSRRAQIAT
jgi:hypothetical protein